MTGIKTIPGKRKRMKKSVRTLVIAAVWLVIWQAAAWLIDRPVIFVGPDAVGRALAQQLRQPDFWLTVMRSSVNICGGFLMAFAAGLGLGITAGRVRILKEFLEPAFGFFQSVPVASFVILALIWVGSGRLSVLISFLIVLPVIYRNTLQGMDAADAQLLEMARVFELGRWKTFVSIYWPSLFPYLLAGSRSAFGMAWKSGVAAEVIGVPGGSIGEKLYLSKIYLSTAELFAWTLVIIAVSRLFEFLFLKLFGLLDERRGAGKMTAGKRGQI